MGINFISTTVTLYNLPVKKKKQRSDFETYFKTSTLRIIVKQNKNQQNNLYHNLGINPPI
jgi:hypothetical protein